METHEAPRLLRRKHSNYFHSILKINLSSKLMSLKVAAESFPTPPSLVVVREYNHERDKVVVEELEKQCEAAPGQQGKPSVLTDMGDPISRVRNFSSHIMLVAEYGKEREIVGVIRGGIKSVTRANEASTNHELPVYVRLACILGLRVSSAHRRLGIGRKLVHELEERCRQIGVEYTYMATENSNEPSVNLFTLKCNYIKFRSPTVLAQPVHAHRKPLGSGTTLIRVPPNLSELMYRRIFASSEFFPQDIDVILKNKLNLGTFMAVPKKCLSTWDVKSGIFPPSYAILSIWNTKDVYRLKMEGFSSLKYAGCRGSWALDKLLPWLRLPSIPNIFKYFGYYFLFGLHMEGKNGRSLMKSLSAFAHNMAIGDPSCCFVVAEVSQKDPIREAIPHWRMFSWEDLWCMKRLTESKNEEHIDDWINSPVSSPMTFVDPREF